MGLTRRGVIWSGLIGTVGAGVVTVLFAVRFRGEPSVLAGVLFGVAAVGGVLAVGTAGWLYASETSGEEPYVLPATVGSAALITTAAADTLARRGETTDLTLGLLAAAVLTVAGGSILLVTQLRP